ncbi:hypothetical protein CK203_061009 [Vitis vinifera]|uniref:Uncharacterized protein n=1 Tax=Vitis vinifera TaxID=29760 RepID=A0A438GGZ8_VITVI|nr:hypothetical protein CK203_061009 [Vitis vinifera]
MEILGDEIDGETQVDMVLGTLPNSFKHFKINYNMNKMVMSLPELIRELQAVEGILKDQKDIHMSVKHSSCYSSQKKKKSTKSTKQKGKFKGNRKKKKKRKGQGASVFFVVRKAIGIRNSLSS